MKDFPLFAFGAVFGILFILTIIVKKEEYRNEVCQKEHNVYMCERVYLPLEPEEDD